MKILLTRHGQTNWNVEGKIQGVTDIELNETGINQAKEVREKLLDYDIDLILSSPLKRTIKTAEIIAEGRNIPIIKTESLKERRFGIFEGKTRKEFDLDSMWDYKLNKKIEGAEPMEDLLKRIKDFLEKIKEEYEDKTVLLVTHGGVTVPIRMILENIPYDTEKLVDMSLENCEIKEYNL